MSHAARLLACLVIVLCAATAAAQTRTLQVGPTRALKTPSQAAAIARDGDVIAIDSATYLGDVATWRQNNLTLRGVGTTRAVLRANGNSAGGKGIWVISGLNVRVENIEFAEARVPDLNGAGIRHEGSNSTLTVVNCLFRDNENGILSTTTANTGELSVSNSEFARNGHGDGRSHGLYANQLRKLTVQASYFHDTPVGHLVKSRAQENRILYNRIVDGAAGTSSYNIDLSNGGLSYVIGNEIRQSPRTQNNSMIAYAAEGVRYADNRLFLIDNTIVNDLGRGTFIMNRGPTPAQLVNNILLGAGAVMSGTGVLTNNLLATWAGGTPSVPVLNGNGNSGNRMTANAMLANVANDDYRLLAGSPAIGVGVDPAGFLGGDPAGGSGSGIVIQSEYLHPLKTKYRRPTAPFDAGAHAYP